ncbi:TIGR01459 family HAD-type hydrolase [Desertibaculum subflavum]|uniref:TIGR01459 family HAD-type hydrolase n=1 Tax=Desertibaculum subflavum TaxID=2268458 RepID=UPI0013C415E8
MTLTSFRFIDHLAEIAERFDGFIFDLWGVVHDGKAPYPGALTAMAAIKRSARPILLLSNAPRRSDAVAVFLDKIGVPRDAYDGVLTSGDLVHAALLRGEPGGRNAKCLRIGPERDHGLIDGLDVRLIDDVQTADLLLVTGLHDDERETADDYRALLDAALRRRLPLVCANPDLSVMRGTDEVPCAGAIAALYESMGGQVHWFGKPDASAYRASVDRLGLPAARLLAVGDSFRTDIQGASRFGIASLFVAGGLHGSHWRLGRGERPPPALIEAEATRWNAWPHYVTALLTW